MPHTLLLSGSYTETEGWCYTGVAVGRQFVSVSVSPARFASLNIQSFGEGGKIKVES